MQPNSSSEARPRRLVVNADDFGYSEGVNRGIIRGHERGIITSASLMVRGPAAVAAADYARRRERLGVGLHVDLGEWIYADGEWREKYRVVSLDDEAAVAHEVDRQLERYRELMGCDPGHLDSHQHVHGHHCVRNVLVRLATQLNVPLRSTELSIAYCGDFYGQDVKGHPCPDMIAADALVGVLKALPDGDTELACHPARTRDFDSVYSGERLIELRSLCDSKVRATVTAERIKLCRFVDLRSVPGDSRHP